MEPEIEIGLEHFAVVVWWIDGMVAEGESYIRWWEE